MEAVLIDRFKMVIKMGKNDGLGLKGVLNVAVGNVFAVEDDG